MKAGHKKSLAFFKKKKKSNSWNLRVPASVRSGTNLKLRTPPGRSRSTVPRFRGSDSPKSSRASSIGGRKKIVKIFYGAS